MHPADLPDETRQRPGRPGAPARPLLVTSDEAVLDSLLRLTAAAGVTPDVAPDEGAARRPWSAASLVLVDGDVAPGLVRSAPPRRAGVLVVTGEPESLAAWQCAVRLGAERVVLLPGDESWLVGRLAEAVEPPSHAAFTAAVVGGCGGAGASIFAAGLGVAASELGARALLLDVDPLGGGLDLVLGSESVPGVRWPDLLGTTGRVSAVSLRDALPRVGTLAALSWDRSEVSEVPATVMREVLAAGRRGHDVVVADLPRRIDALAEEALVQADVTYLVVRGDVRAVAAAARLLRTLDALTSQIELVVRGRGSGGLDGSVVSETLGVPLAAEMRAERGLRAALDLGEGLGSRRRGPLARTCRDVLGHELGSRGWAA